MRVGIICEGSSDYPVLRHVVEKVIGADVVFTELQPDFDALSRRVPETPGPGWHGVRKFLGQPQLAVAAGVHDILVVHVDADIRHEGEIASSLTSPDEKAPELQPLCDEVKRWMGIPTPEGVVIVLPREAIESWLLAAHAQRKSVEDIEHPTKQLVRAGLIASGRPDKERARYRDLARGLDAVLKNTAGLARNVPELDRFVGKLRSRARILRARPS